MSGFSCVPRVCRGSRPEDAHPVFKAEEKQNEARKASEAVAKKDAFPRELKTL